MRRSVTIISLSLACLSLCAPPAGAQWTALGLSGRHVNRLHSDGDFLYACASDGLHRLSLADPDTVWTQAGFAGRNVLDLASLGPLTLLASAALTGAPDDTVSLYRSIDGGDTWQPFQNGFGAGGGNSGRQARRLLALAGSPGTILGVGGRIEKSTDSGLSWRIVAQGFAVNAIEQAPANPQLVWAGGETVIFAPFVLKSDNAGETWKQTDIFAGGDNAVDAIAGHPTDSSVVYLGMEGRVMKSEDGGMTWWNMTSPDPSMYTFGMGIRSFLPLKIYAAGASVVPDPRGVVFHQSLNGGLSWRAITYPAYAGYGVRHLLLGMSPVEERVYVATENGVYRYSEVPVGMPASEGVGRVLMRCRPNPFFRSAALEFTLASTERASLRILDLRGRVVATLLDGVLGAGPHRATWDGRGVGSGIYFSRLESEGRVETLKMLYLR